MKNFKSIAATLALTAAFTINSFGGVSIADFRTDEKPTCTAAKKPELIPNFTGIIVYLTGIIVYAVEPSKECKEDEMKGVSIAD
jgi:hypothetical protein